MVNLSPAFVNVQPALDNGLEGLYLVRSYKGEKAYRVITDLPLDEAAKISLEAYPQRDAEGYMEKRFKVDNWLRENAQKADVHITKYNPISFSVVRDLDAWKSALQEGDGTIILPLREVDLSNWSFTLDDSFVSAPEDIKGDTENFGYPDHDLHGRVLNGEELLEIIQKGEFPQEEINEHPRYFEAQLWASAPTLKRVAELNPDSYVLKGALTR